jgi:hypothetical protein
VETNVICVLCFKPQDQSNSPILAAGIVAEISGCQGSRSENKFNIISTVIWMLYIIKRIDDLSFV